MTTPTDKSEVSSPNRVKHLKNFNNALALKLDECIQERDALQSQLTDLRAQVEHLQSDLRTCQQLGNTRLDTISRLTKDLSQVETLKIERDEARVARDFAEISCDKAHSDGAVMRGALEEAKERSLRKRENWHFIDKALSTSRGSDLLDRYREAVKALEKVCSTYDQRDIDHLKTSPPKSIAGEITAEEILACHRALLATVKGDL